MDSKKRHSRYWGQRRQRPGGVKARRGCWPPPMFLRIISSKESWGRGVKELAWGLTTGQQETCVSKELGCWRHLSHLHYSRAAEAEASEELVCGEIAWLP